MQGKNTLATDATPTVYVGIDVSKDWLDVYLHPLGRTLRATNDRTGLRRVRAALAGLTVARVVMEPTAKYHRRAHRTLHEAGFAVAVFNPLRARQFAQARGALAKTDAIDARLLALLGEALGPEARPPVPEALEALQELVRARQVAAAGRAALKNRRSASASACVRTGLDRLIESFDAELARLDCEIATRIDADPALARRAAILRSIPGIGPVAAATLVALMAELGSLTGKAAALLAGLAPIAADSGAHTGQRHIRGGRANVRSVLYMAALAARNHNPDLKAFYRRLIEQGKKPKVALTAVMRKLIVLANILLAENRTWQPKTT